MPPFWRAPRADGAATKGEGVLILSAAPAVGRVPGSAGFAARYQAKYAPIANYAVNSHDSARLVLNAVESAALAVGLLAAFVPYRGWRLAPLFERLTRR
jgi:hypothetical protein